MILSDDNFLFIKKKVKIYVYKNVKLNISLEQKNLSSFIVQSVKAFNVL